MLRYQEVLEKRLNFIKDQPEFKKNKRSSKLAGLITIGIFVLFFMLTRLIISEQLSEAYFFIQPAFLMIIIMSFYGLGCYIYSRFSKPAGLVTLFLATILLLFIRFFVTRHLPDDLLLARPGFQAAVITFFVGLGIIISKLFISNKLIKD